MRPDQNLSTTLIGWLFFCLGIIGVLLTPLLEAYKLSTAANLALNLGATLIATSILAFLYRRFGEDSVAAHFPIVKDFFELGIDGMWLQRNELVPSFWNEFTGKARREVILLGVAEYGFARDDVFSNIVDNGTKAGCNYKFLLLSPDSPVASSWDASADHVPSKIRVSIKRFTDLVESCRGRAGHVELHTYEEAPTFSIVCADRHIMATFYVPKREGDACFTVKLRRLKGGLFDQYQQHFERLWKESKLVASTRI